MAHGRDERVSERTGETDTTMMESTAEQPTTRMTDKGNIPPVMNGFADSGPSASDRAYGGYVRVQASTLNVRAEPTTDSKVVGKLHRGKLVEQRGQVGDWVQIAYAGGTAYVHGSYVEPADTRPSQETTADMMNDFREVNDDQGRGAPPGKETTADMMNDFREVNGDQGRGAPPSKETTAEMMNDFREVNGDQGRGAPPKMTDEERKKLLDELE
jgi:uncharacterized protein YgiM (DUF1202 family)